MLRLKAPSTLHSDVRSVGLFGDRSLPAGVGNPTEVLGDLGKDGCIVPLLELRVFLSVLRQEVAPKFLCLHPPGR